MKIELFHEESQKVRSLIEGHNYHAVIELLLGCKRTYVRAPDSNRAAYYCTLGISFSKMGNYKEADHHFDLALAATPHNHKILLEIADSYLQRGQLGNAERSLIELFEDPTMERSGYNRRLHILMGKYFKLTGDFASARDSYYASAKEDYYKRDPANDLSKIDAFISSSKKYSDSTVGLTEYAHHLFHIDRKSNPPTNLSITFLQNSFKDVKGIDAKVQCLAKLSQFHLDSNRIDKAIEYNNQALHLLPKHPRSLTARIRLLFETGRDIEAVEQYHQDKMMIKEDPRATLALANVFKFARMNEIANTIVSELLSSEDLAPDLRGSALMIQSITRRQPPPRYPAQRL